MLTAHWKTALRYLVGGACRNLTPVWDETAAFRGVARGDLLHVSVFDRRLVGPHMLLGQVVSR